MLQVLFLADSVRLICLRRWRALIIRFIYGLSVTTPIVKDLVRYDGKLAWNVSEKIYSIHCIKKHMWLCLEIVCSDYVKHGMLRKIVAFIVQKTDT